MPISDAFDMSVSFLQIFGSQLSVPDFDLPDAWEGLKSVVTFVQLGLQFFQSYAPDLEDARIYFIAVCASIPIAISVIGMVLLNPLYIVLWYMALCAGVACASAGGYGVYLGKNGTTLSGGIGVSSMILTVGIVLLVSCVVLLFFRRLAIQRCKLESPESEALTVEQRCEEETVYLPIGRVVQCLVMSLLMGIIAAVMIADPTGLFQSYSLEVMGYDVAKFRRGIGITAAVVGSLFLIALVLNLTQVTRRLVWKAGRLVLRHATKFLLLGISIAYVPIGTGLLTVFNCNEFQCQSGERFLQPNTDVVYDLSIANFSNPKQNVCAPCAVASGQICPLELQDTLCDGVKEERLEVDRRLPCSYLQRFFWPAAIGVILVYMLGVPILFYQLITIATLSTVKHFPISDEEEAAAGDDFERLYELKVKDSNNVATFLYAPFEPKLRYSRLFLTLHKLGVVIATAFILRLPSPKRPDQHTLISQALTFVVHTGLLVWLVLKRPYLLLFEDVACIVLQVVLMVGTLAAMLLQLGVKIPKAVVFVIGIVVMVVPAVVVAGSIVFEFIDRRGRKTVREEAKRDMLKQELADMEREFKRDPGASPVRHEFETSNGHISMEEEETVGSRLPVATLSPQQQRARERIIAEAELRVVGKVEKKDEILVALQEDADMITNLAVRNRLSLFLVVLGVMAGMSLGVAAVGLREESGLGPVKHDLTDTSDNQLAGYSSWEEFTTKCCCLTPGDIWAAGGDLVEQWVCQSGRTKERIRERRDVNGTVAVSGVPVRPVCGINFRFDCDVFVERANRTLQHVVTFNCTSAPGADRDTLW